jgi:hypothetical protein
MKDVKFFSEMPSDMRRFVFERMKHEHVPCDTIVFEEGDPGPHYSSVLSSPTAHHFLMSCVRGSVR